MKDYVLRKIYRGEWRKVDKAIVKWRRERRARLALEKAELELEQEKAKDKRNLLAKNLFTDESDS